MRIRESKAKEIKIGNGWMKDDKENGFAFVKGNLSDKAGFPEQFRNTNEVWMGFMKVTVSFPEKKAELGFDVEAI